MKTLLSLIFFLSLRALAVDPPLVTLDGESGLGTLTYAAGEKKEPVVFGPKSGRFILAFAVEGRLLPENFRKDFTGKWVIQVAMGNLKSTHPSDLPQFGSATWIVSALPTAKTTINIRIPDAREKNLKNTGYLVFNSPTTPSERSGEDKLKSTYFGSLGTTTLVPQGEKRKVSMNADGKTLLFFEQNMRADINSEMSTPFNASTTHLGGAVEFPVYWPANKSAEAFAKTIVSAGFEKKPLK